METLNRLKCSVTNKEDLEKLYLFKRVPIFMGCTNQKHENDIFEDMSWSISRSSGLIQLDRLIPLKILYAESHGSGDIGVLWNNHHKEFANFIKFHSPKSVFEIGGGHGRLAKIYCQSTDIPWTILEPNPSPENKNPAKYIRGFFDKNFKTDAIFDTVVHSHTIEHLYNHNEFMRDLSTFMQIGTKLIFSVPNLKEMLKRNYTNTLNFEHTVFLTEPYIEYLLGNFGFKIIEKKYFMDDHSIFYATIRDKNCKLEKLNTNLYEENKTLFTNFINKQNKLIHDLNLSIKSSPNKIYLFGAHIFSQFLIQCGLNTNNIICILDNDPNKQGKRLYGTDMIVKSPNCIENDESPIIILKAGGYNNEIKKDIIENINRKAEFWE